MKKILITGAALFTGVGAFACDACKKQKPEFLQDIGHGRGPESQWDYLIVIAMVMITLYVLFATIKCFIRPRDTSDIHIKRLILKD